MTKQRAAYLRKARKRRLDRNSWRAFGWLAKEFIVSSDEARAAIGLPPMTEVKEHRL